MVVVLADDLGWGDLSTGRTNGGHPHRLHRTPAIDDRAREGVVFDNAYAAQTCAPSRAALLTGMSAPRPDNGIFAVTDLDRVGAAEPMLEGAAQGRGDGATVIPQRATTVAEAVQEVGYATGYAGKFQITGGASNIVDHHGFDENLGGGNTGAADSYHAERHPEGHRGRRFDDKVWPTLDRFAEDYTEEYVRTRIAPYSHDVPPGEVDKLVGTPKHLTDALTDSATDFIDRHADRPFLFWMSHVAVHDPIDTRQPRRDLLAKYRAMRRDARDDDQATAYAGLVEGLDQSVARTVDHLMKTEDPRNPGRPLAENTIVVVTSDNGGRTDLGASNGPLRGQKGLLLEGGIRVPWIVWSANPDLVERGRLNHSVIDGTDLYATVADYAGARPRPEAPLDGRSLRGALQAGETLDGPRFGHVPGYLVSGVRDQRPGSWVRHGRWKLAHDYETQTFTLHDVEADPGERRDLAGRRPEEVQRLGTTLLEWLDETDAPLATVRRTTGPVRLTVHGRTYADGEVTVHPRPERLVVRPGEEMPFVLPAAS
ncbi:sulfatase-like hydrolase/transferase [Nocardioides sp. CFH 31398]|uniref:sulfatase-like hydrolase/transferase n=1 Tax=Nocardioides sp. CFH 31398 TaxID=2919579 RepID=UPI001F051E4D|nr:sulfatase-like hydrolase/transferase [Nocardioides sp. CFH 31398]MCH1866763.1 sulfatase-like hydrolase/transferase [Nocardioides sp. CFH 31398]